MALQDRPNLQDYPAENARQGEIILKTPLQRGIFIAGLAGMILLPVLLYLLG